VQLTRTLLITLDRSAGRCVIHCHRPGVLPIQVGHHAGGAGGYLGGEGHRIGLEAEAVVGGHQLELVVGARLDAGMNSSHTPEEPSERIWWTRPSQKFQSPTTRTA